MSFSSSVFTFMSVPFVQHIYGTLFYILVVLLYSLVLLQKFYPAPEPQEFAVYAVQGLHFGMTVFTVVRDWRRAHEFIWHRSRSSRFSNRSRFFSKKVAKPQNRSFINLSTGISWILLTFAIIMRSLSISNNGNVLQLSDELYTGLLIFALSFLFALPKFFQRFCVNKKRVAAIIG